MRLSLQLLLSLALSSMLVNADNYDNIDNVHEVNLDNKYDDDNEYDECGIYLAPSSIPGAGLGLYSGSRPYKIRDRLLDPDLLVLITQIEWHNSDHYDYSDHDDEDEDENEQDEGEGKDDEDGGDEFHWTFQNYVWHSSLFPGTEHDVDDALRTTVVVSTGFGAAINCMLPLINVADEDEPYSYQMTLSGVSSDSPGAGAFTPYYGRRFMATRDIQPYSELFASYGEAYFTARPEYDTIPFLNDYDIADEFLNGLLGMMRRLRKGHGRPWVSYDKKQRTKRQNPLLVNADFHIDLIKTISEPFRLWKPRTYNALPDTAKSNLDDIDNLMQAGGTKYRTYNNTVRGKQWMKKHGQCIDNIKDGVSSIPHAGRGAFARRFIPKDGLVTPMPLLHIPNRSSFAMYDSYKDIHSGEWVRNTSAPPIGYQLLLNYCFGHRQSTLLLCPYGSLNLHVNHDAHSPNSKISWSDRSRMSHPEWLDMPIKQWGHSLNNGLMMDLVALRDIYPDEEITFDYGAEWQSAWQEHVLNYDAPRRGYIPAFELNKKLDLKIPTVYESHDEQFLDVLTSCRDHYFVAPTNDVEPFRFGFEGEDDFDDIYLCRILQRFDMGTTTTEDDRYIAEVFTRKHFYYLDEDIEETVYDIPVMILFDLPRDAFIFRDIPYKRDHQQEFAFRHDMRIPDEIFPQIWRNK